MSRSGVPAVCVLRSGGDYRPEHVLRLKAQLEDAGCGARFICLTDMDVPGVETRQLTHHWPGWWSKMEVFCPSLAGDILYLDLDTTVIGAIDGWFELSAATIMRDVYRPAGLQSSIMFLPEAARATIWSAWKKAPDIHMRRHRRGGDQAFLETCDVDWQLWQEVMPGQLVSYKADVRGRGVPQGARVIVHHGSPRPWEVGA